MPSKVFPAKSASAPNFSFSHARALPPAPVTCRMTAPRAATAAMARPTGERIAPTTPSAAESAPAASEASEASPPKAMPRAVIAVPATTSAAPAAPTTTTTLATVRTRSRLAAIQAETRCVTPRIFRPQSATGPARASPIVPSATTAACLIRPKTCERVSAILP